MNYSYMNTFYTVATLGNISKAADELFVSQPAISRIIRELESEYGTKLFERSKSGVTLTREGQNLFNTIKEPFKELKKVEGFLDTPGCLNQTIVDIGATATAMEECLLPKFDKYKSMFPNLNFRIKTDSSQRLIKNVMEGSIDFAFITTPYFDNKDLECHTIRRFKNILIAPIEYKDKIKGPISIKDLVGFPFILLNKKMQFRQHVDKYFSDHKVHITPTYEVDSSGALIPFVINNCGLSFVPERTAKEYIDEGKCFKVELIEEMPVRKVTFIIKKSKNYSPVIKEIHQLIVKSLVLLESER